MISSSFPKTVLFDLDGTLLPMDHQVFEHAYFKLLGETLPEIPSADLVKYIWYGTKAMITNDGKKYNREAFAEAFSSISGIDFYANESRFEKFYETSFQNLKKLCPITDTSRHIIETLQAKGYRIGIATNPIFPRIATYSRLKWLGIDPNRLMIITTYDNSHFAKPNPEYYKEVLRNLGIGSKEAIMIGNDVSEDGIAQSLGLRVVLIEDCLINKKDAPYDQYEHGSLKELYQTVKEVPYV